MRSFIKLLFLFSVLSFLVSGCIFGITAETAQNDGWTIQAETDTGVGADIDTYTEPNKDNGWDSEVYADAKDAYETDTQPPVDTDISETQDGGELDTETSCNPTSCPAPSSCAKGVQGIKKCGSSSCQCVKYTGPCSHSDGSRTFSYTYDSMGRRKKRFDSNRPNYEWRYIYSNNSDCPDKRKMYVDGQLERTSYYTCKNGRRIELKQGQKTFKFIYNAKGWLIEKELWKNGSRRTTLTFNNDPAGNIKSNSAGYTYDYAGCGNQAP